MSAFSDAMIRPIIAVFGKCCVGKTSVADSLSLLLGITSHHCGAAVRDAARNLGISSAELSVSMHAEIDGRTIGLVSSPSPPGVIEGAFLDIVLGESKGVSLVQLTCRESARGQRFESRPLGTRVYQTLAERDRADDDLRTRLYGVRVPSQTVIVVDTSDLGPDTVSTLIVERLGL
jgi:cytidylate kinase